MHARLHSFAPFVQFDHNISTTPYNVKSRFMVIVAKGINSILELWSCNLVSVSNLNVTARVYRTAMQSS